MNIAILGLGEVGQILSSALASSGSRVWGYDPGNVSTPEGVFRASTVAEAVANADFVVSLTTARFAVSAAHDSAPYLRSSAVYVDLNAASPTAKQDVERAVGSRGHVVDGAIIGSVQNFGSGVQVLLSGRRRTQAADMLKTAGVDAENVEGPVGEASSRKLLRSVFMKGLAALIDETVTAGAKAGQNEWVREQVAETLKGGMPAVDHFYRGIRKHAKRRSDEVDDSLSLIEELGGIWPMTVASRERHLALARDYTDRAEAFQRLRRIPTSAIGDGSDRLGYAGPGISAVWDCPRTVGPARTVLTRPGDNYAIHAIMETIEPGEILVVSTNATQDRALIGDLLAERAMKHGVAGIVLDGPVRDVSGIIDSGIPIWARGVSAAGPYKHGPMRSDIPIPIGDAVCSPGDIVVADLEGIMFINPNSLIKTINDADAVLEREAEKRQALRRA